MPDKNAAPNITVTLRTGQVGGDRPLLRFVRWKLMPFEEARVPESEAQEDPEQTEPPKRTP